MIFNHLDNIHFIYKALIAGIGIATVAGPLGSLMIWRRMAYFGDTLAHSTLMGVSLALLLNINIYLGLISICVLVSVLLIMLSKQQRIASDAILVILSHATLAVGLGLSSMLESVRLDLLGYLYGDILAVTTIDIVWVLAIAIAVLCAIVLLWRWLLAMTVDPAIAKVEGVPIEAMRITLIFMMALVFAIAMKLVGVLLITALLIIPASAARWLSRSPEQMALLASILGIIAVASGLWISLIWDWPTGPTIVIAATSLFCISLLARKNAL